MLRIALASLLLGMQLGVASDALYFTPSPYVPTSTLWECIPPSYQEITTDFAYLQLFSLTFLVGLWLVPNDLSHWQHDEIIQSGIGRDWVDNVHAGPVWDRDPWAINYIGHTLSGAYYYTAVRNRGLSIAESVMMNALLSTLYWEYGVEATFEIPSYQDLWVTPLLGSIVGEGFYQLQERIRANEGMLWGSRRWGNTAMFFLNLEGELANVLRRFFYLNRRWVDFSLTTQWRSPLERYEIGTIEPMMVESYIGLVMRIRF